MFRSDAFKSNEKRLQSADTAMQTASLMRLLQAFVPVPAIRSAAPSVAILCVSAAHADFNEESAMATEPLIINDSKGIIIK